MHYNFYIYIYIFAVHFFLLINFNTVEFQHVSFI